MTKSPSRVRRTERKSITPGERLALIGIAALGHHHNQQLKELEAAALAITREVDTHGQPVEVLSGGTTAETLYEMSGNPAAAVDRAIKHLGLTVEKPKKRRK